MKSSSHPFVSAILFSCLISFPVKTIQAQIQVGSGSYSTVLPPKAVGPSTFQGASVSPKVSPDFSQPVQTNDFWSSLIFPFYGSQFSNTLYVHPLVVKAESAGLGIGYTKDPVYAAADYLFPYQQQLLAGVDGLKATQTLVDSYGDWTVTASWSEGTRAMKATFGHGIPFVFFTIAGGNASITVKETPVIWSNQNGVVGLTAGGRHYGIFGPAGSAWTGTSVLKSSLNGKNFFSVAILPDNTPATLEFYRKRAYAFVTGSQVSWQYDEASAKLNSTFSLTTTLMETGNGNLPATLTALYRHQWLNTSHPLTAFTYTSVHGTMKVFDGNEFSTTVEFNGVLPALPNEGIYNPAQLNSYLDQVKKETLPAGPVYENGKLMARFANLVPVADQAGNSGARDYFLSQLKKRLEAWLTAGGAEELSYVSKWNTLIAYPSGYGADNQLNDHNFHYGYLIMAASTVAQYDSAWAAPGNWGGMVDLLIRDCANWDRSDGRFPFLRAFDPYAGHSWEAGHGDFGDGNNEESSSESMNFATSLILWGSATGNKEIRDLGIFLYTTERTAIEHYWFDVDNAVFPAAYGYEALGMVWGGKGVHSTWFGADPEFIHGINLLPLTGGSLYLGRHPEYVMKNYNEMTKEIGSLPRKWKDIFWQYLAFADPQTALNQYYADPGYEPFDGESRAHTYHWLGNLIKTGKVSTTIFADIPTFAVFETEKGIKTYVAWNPGSDSVRVHFSDGFSLMVPARKQVSYNTDPAGKDAPVSVPLASVSSGKAPLKISFSGSSSFDRSGLPLSYHWEFGDGTSSSQADTVHDYPAPGIYTAELTVTNSLNKSGKGELRITVIGNGTPYKGTPVLLPGTIQAENYDLGGEGTAYHDADPKNQGVPFRSSEGVDIENCSDTGGGYDVGWTAAGEWLEYTVEVADAGDYDLTVRTASVPGIGAYHLEFNGQNVTGKKLVPATGGWQFWKDVTSAKVPLSKGKQILRLAIESPEFTINSITVKKSTSVGIQDGSAPPAGFTMEQNYPNPFNPVTRIPVSLPTAAFIRLTLYNVLGEEVKTLVSGTLPAGIHLIQWDAAEFPSGVYFCRFEAGTLSQTRKLILVK
ncbi:MAG: carbohydrate-binding protein [Bacteroidetes bacterium]|nr:carbohydrate-binding protein [Bacteroidota bacterium]